MAEIRPQPQSPALGALARMLGSARDAAGRVRIDSQLLGQTSLADLLSLPGAAGLAEDVSYFGPAAMLRPGSGRTLQTFKIDPRVLDAADVALNVSPLGALAAKGAARAARPVARAAGEAVNRAMLTGEGPLAAALAPVAPRQLTVYHGTPHRFERFDASKIGTGEGAQVYGHGLYFAESPEVAKSYAVPRGVPDVEGMALRRGIDADRDMLVEIMRQAAADREPMEAAKFLQYANIKARGVPKEKLADVITEYRAAKQPSFYTVDLPDEAIARMLDWDKPLSEQPPQVKKAVAVRFDELRSLGASLPADPSGEWLHRSFHPQAGEEGFGQSLAAERLRAMGIPGIKYLDQVSRNKPLKDIRREFLNELPEDAGLDEVVSLLGTGTFSPKNEAIIKALAENDWLGFDYPSQALSTALSPSLNNYDFSSSLMRAVNSAQEGGTRNFVVFPGNEDLLRIIERNNEKLPESSPGYAEGGAVQTYAQGGIVRTEFEYDPAAVDARAAALMEEIDAA